MALLAKQHKAERSVFIVAINAQCSLELMCQVSSAIGVCVNEKQCEALRVPVQLEKKTLYHLTPVI